MLKVKPVFLLFFRAVIHTDGRLLRFDFCESREIQDKKFSVYIIFLVLFKDIK